MLESTCRVIIRSGNINIAKQIIKPRNMFCLFIERKKAANSYQLFMNMFKKAQGKIPIIRLKIKIELYDFLCK